MLIKWFAFTKDKINSLYTKNNIKKDYNASENDFAAHLLEYQVHRNKWDKRFADKGIQQKFQKKVTMEQIKEVDKTGLKTPAIEGTPAEEKKQPGKQETPLFKPNPYLMRKIWSMYTGKNVEQEKKTQDEAESQFINAQVVSDVGEGRYVSEMIGTTGDMYRTHFDTREKAERSSKNHKGLGFDSRVVEEPEEKPVSEDIEKEADVLVRVNINTQMLIENQYKQDNSETKEDKIKSLKKLKSKISPEFAIESVR